VRARAANVLLAGLVLSSQVLSGQVLPSQAAAQESSAGELNARDAFFSAADMLGPARKAPANPAPAKPKPQNTPTPAKPKPPRREPNADPLAARRKAAENPENHFRETSHEVRLPALRYSVLKQTPQGDVEVPVDTVFHDGDRIRVRVLANQNSYLYLVARGSSGAWSPLFPHPESTAKSNEIIAGRKYEAPGGDGEYFTFDSKSGEERLIILLTPQPVGDMDDMILKMANPAGGQQMSAQLDERWTELRGELQARDLVFTRVKASGAEKENAEYVAAPSGNKVLVELPLKHQ